LAGALAASQSTGARGGDALSPEQAKILQGARLYALGYISALPNFICTQVTDRDTTRTGAAIEQDGSFGVGGLTPKSEVGHGPSDRIVEKLTYFSQRENYEVISVNGKTGKGLEHAKLTGATSAGEFGTAISAVFDPHSKTTFVWRRPASIRGRKAFVFAFRVPKEAGIKVSARNAGEDIVAPYHGLVFVDEETSEVLRITTEFDLPKDFPIQAADRLVDYRPTEVAGRRYVLPFHSEVTMESNGQKFVNKIEFKDYHRFAVESTLQFGGPEEAGAGARKADAGAAGPERTEAAHEEAAKPEPPSAGSDVAPATTPALAGGGKAGVGTDSVPNHAEAGGAAVTGIAPAAPRPDTRAEPTFTLRMNSDLVLVPVVVRDRNGSPVADLKIENFQVLDNGKRQEIVDLTVVREGGGGAAPVVGAGAAAVGTPDHGILNEDTHYIVYLFDDLHLTGEDMANAKRAATHSLDSLTAKDRAAVISTSGEVTTPLTDDRRKLAEAVAKLRVQPVEGGGGCPPMNYYMANEMVRGTGGGTAMEVAAAETIGCMRLPPSQAAQAANMAMQTARNVAAVGEQRSRGSLQQIRAVVRWLEKAPGSRSIVLVSPGFVLNTLATVDSGALVDEAIRNQVVISALDVRGVHGADASGSIEEKSTDGTVSRDKAALAVAEITATEGAMGGIAEGTGGLFVRNSNDLDGGLRRMLAAPACMYVLAFRPSHLKADGGYHALEVKVEGGGKLAVQARPGYFAPKQ
jgi:VWFA-related protein